MSKKLSSPSVETPSEPLFHEVVGFIENAREHPNRSVKTALIELYWRVAEYVSLKAQNAG